MKISIAVARKDAPTAASVALRGFQRSIERAGEFGYDGIELALGSVSDIDRSSLERTLVLNNCEVSCISTGLVFAESHLSLTDVSSSGRARQILSELIRIAPDLGGKVALGRVCGSIPAGMSREQALSLFLEHVKPLCEQAEKLGVLMMLEPLNRFVGNLINTVEQAIEIIESVDCANLGIMPDSFHMNIEEKRIGSVLVAGGCHIGHLHLADSNRLAPGQGHIDFLDIFDALSAIDYSGWCSVEILPIPTPDQAAAQAADFLRMLLKGKTS